MHHLSVYSYPAGQPQTSALPPTVSLLLLLGRSTEMPRGRDAKWAGYRYLQRPVGMQRAGSLQRAGDSGFCSKVVHLPMNTCVSRRAPRSQVRLSARGERAFFHQHNDRAWAVGLTMIAGPHILSLPLSPPHQLQGLLWRSDSEERTSLTAAVLVLRWGGWPPREVVVEQVHEAREFPKRGFLYFPFSLVPFTQEILRVS